MTITDEKMRELMPTVQRALRGYVNHSQYDDMLSCAYVSVWKQLLRTKESDVRHLRNLVIQISKCAAAEFYRSSECETRDFTRAGVEASVVVSLDQPIATGSEECGSYWDVVDRTVAEPGFEDQLVERLWFEQLMDQVTSGMPPEQEQVILAVRAGMTFVEMAGSFETKRTTLGQRYRRAKQRMQQRAHTLALDDPY